MGLDTTHGCWNGPYSQFHQWRKAIAKTIAIDLDQMSGFEPLEESRPVRKAGAPDGIEWTTLPPDILHVLLNHQDCEGEIEHKDCLLLAQRLIEVLPSIPSEWVLHTIQFIAGLLLAYTRNQNVKFQ